jgi:hypothetical protein
MKKTVVLMITIFLVFSINCFSQDKTHKTVQSAKIEQPKKGNAKAGRKPRKSKSKKMIHKSGPKRRSQKKTGNEIKL